jgi:hypothetical protein
MKKKTFGLIISLFLITNFVSAQEPVVEFNKNYIYADLNISAGILVALNYERTLIEIGNWSTLSLAGSAGYQSTLFAERSGLCIGLKGFYCLKLKSHNLEFGAGWYELFPRKTSGFEPVNSLPDFSVGYKFQKAGSPLLIKTSIGLINFIDLGIGYTF